MSTLQSYASLVNSHQYFVQRTVKHGIKMHLWGYFSKQGFGTLYLFIHNLNAEKMLQIYKKALLPEQALYRVEEAMWHCCIGLVVAVPRCEPNRKCVGIKQKLIVSGKHTHALKQLSCEICRIWRSLLLEYAVNLVESVPRRCQRIIAADGD